MNGAITSEGMDFFHNDTYGIAFYLPLSIPTVSDTGEASTYHVRMENDPLDSWEDWGPRFKMLAKENGETLATVAETMGLTEAALRHWTNGTREINLVDFMRMCKAARVHPSLVLFEGPPMDPETKRRIGELAKSAIDNDRRLASDYKKIVKPQRPKRRRTST